MFEKINQNKQKIIDTTYTQLGNITKESIKKNGPVIKEANKGISAMFWLFLFIFALSALFGNKPDVQPTQAQAGEINSDPVMEAKEATKEESITTNNLKPQISLQDRLNQEIKETKEYNLNFENAQLGKEAAPVESSKAVKLLNKIKELENKSPMDVNYIQAFINAGCNEHSLLSYLAISGHETEFGRTAPSYMEVNFVGFFLNGNKKYDPDLNTFASVICKRFNDTANFYHGRIISLDGTVNSRLATIYSGNDKPVTWTRNVSKFYTTLKNL